MGSGSGIRDLESGIRKKPIPDPRSRIQGSKRHRIPDPDPQHWVIGRVVNLWLYLVGDELRLDELRGSGYDMYVKDATRLVPIMWLKGLSHEIDFKNFDKNL